MVTPDELLKECIVILYIFVNPTRHIILYCFDMSMENKIIKTSLFYTKQTQQVQSSQEVSNRSRPAAFIIIG